MYFKNCGKKTEKIDSILTGYLNDMSQNPVKSQKYKEADANFCKAMKGIVISHPEKIETYENLYDKVTKKDDKKKNKSNYLDLMFLKFEVDK
jgi:hypothetical protein